MVEQKSGKKGLNAVSGRIENAERRFGEYIEKKEFAKLKELSKYIELLDEQRLRKTFKVISDHAPKSMDPQKISEHFNFTIDFLQGIAKDRSELLEYLVQMKDVKKNKFKAENVDSYTIFMRKYIKGYADLFFSV